MDDVKKPINLPDPGAPVADTHAHLDMLDDPSGALERAAMSRVDLVMTVVDATEAPEATFEAMPGWLAEAASRLADWEIPDTSPPEVRIILGVHPHNAKDFSDEVGARMVAFAEDPIVSGIGEIGLDYFYDYSPRGDQRRAFRTQLALARRLGLPAVVHLRDAHEEGYAILAEESLPEKGCVLHCFTEGPEVAQRFLDLGCHISFAGPVTFKKNDALREAAKLVPLDRILVETDAPFMSPEPYRGRTNEPAWCVLATQRIAEVKGLPVAEVASAAMANARRLFGPR
jgi:TatD DNase family protein